MAVFQTPRFSYRFPETTICACPASTTTSGTCSTARRTGIPGGYWGGYTGWLYRGVPTQHAARGDPVKHPAKRAPEAQRAGVGGVQGSDVLGTAAGRSWVPTLRARSVPCRALPGTQDLANAASWPNRARFHHIYCKVSQNRQVSPKSV